MWSTPTMMSMEALCGARGASVAGFGDEGRVALRGELVDLELRVGAAREGAHAHADERRRRLVGPRRQRALPDGEPRPFELRYYAGGGICGLEGTYLHPVRRRRSHHAWRGRYRGDR